MKNSKSIATNITELPIGKKFWDWRIFKLIAKQAIPGIISSMLLAFVPLIDGLFAGFLKNSNDAIAAVNYSFVIQVLFLVVIFGVHGACSVIFAQYYGASEYDKVKSAHKLKIIFSAFFWFFSLVPMVIFPHQILSLFTSNSLILQYGVTYTRIMGIGLLLYWIAQAYASSLLQMGFATFVLVATLAPILINSVFDYLFTMVFHFHVAGLAYATIISSVVSLIVFESFVRFKHLIIKFNYLILFIFHKEVFMKIINRWHMVIVEFSFGVGILVINIIIARSYNNYHGQTYGVINGMFGIFTRIANAAIVGFYGSVAFFIGKYLGADLFDEAYKNAKRIYIIAFIFAAITSSIISLLSTYYINAFFKHISEPNRVQTIMILRLYCLIFPAFLLGILSFRILEAGGQSKTVMIFDFVHTWVVIVLIGFLVFYVWHPDQYWKAWIVASVCRYTRAIVATFLVEQKLWLVNLLKNDAIEPHGASYIVLSIVTFGIFPVMRKIQKRNKQIIHKQKRN